MARPRVKFTSPFAPLQLAESERETLEHLSRVILRNYVAQYEDFERSSGGVVDERVWKPVKQRENVRVFAQRKHASDAGIAGLKRTVAHHAESGLVQPSDLPVMLIVGSVAGTLDDVMYGIANPTVEVMRVKSAYIDDHVGDAAVLETLVAPTPDAPFESLVLKWVQNETGKYLRPAVSCRDFVYMERTGIAFTSSGERVGFLLLHSVHFPQTHGVAPFVRGNMSVCGLYRQRPHTADVEIYMRGILDARGSMIRPVVVIGAADMLIAAWRFVECSQLKKLMWRLRQKRAAVRLERAKSASSSGNSSGARGSGSGTRSAVRTANLGPCVTCGRGPSMALSVLSDPRLRTCALCDEYVCSSCRLKRRLFQVASPTGKLWSRKFAFCSACHSTTCRSDALAVAQEELAAATSAMERPGDALSWSDPYSPTNSD